MMYGKTYDADFKRYKELKSEFTIGFKNYNLQNIVAHDIAKYIYKNKIPKIKFVFRWFVTPSAQYFKPFFKRKQLISNVYPHRNDYISLFDSVAKELGFDNHFMDYKYGWKIRLVFSFKNIRSSFAEVFRLNVKLSIWTKLYFTACLTYYKNILDLFEKKCVEFLNVELFLASNSSSTPDSVLCVYFNSIGIKTFSFQHGNYSTFQKYIPMDVINTENITAQKMMCWGKSTADLLKNRGCNENSIVITGNPRYKGVVLKDIKQTFGSCIVFLGRSIYHNENIRLLNVLGEFNKNFESIHFFIKLHPSLHKNEYEQVAQKLKLTLIAGNELLTKLIDSGDYDFAISYNSTAYYEPLTRGIPCFRYSYFENENLFGLDDKFETAAELAGLIAKFKNIDSGELARQIQKVLDEVFSITNVNYKRILL